MPVGFPVKDNYVTGDVLTAANMNDFAGTLNTVPNVVGGFAAGKNKIINGDFNINQRNFTTSTTSGTFGFDRFSSIMVDGTVTYSAQTFTTGAAPVAGYEGKNFARIVTTGQTLATARANLTQGIEDVRALAGQTATVSFWAKAATGTPKIAIELNQSFGSGGSPSSGVQAYAGQVTLSTSWARYSATIAIPSISGKTIGTNPDSALQLNLFVSAGSNFNARTGSLGIQSNTFDIWGVQVEAGSIATPFQTATGSIGGELALCQRYYYRNTQASNFTLLPYTASATSTTVVRYEVKLPQTMRANVSSIDYAQFQASDGVTALTVSALTLASASTETVTMTAAVTGATQYRPYYANVTVSGPGHIGYNAEL
jgi:hypothetical protein